MFSALTSQRPGGVATITPAGGNLDTPVPTDAADGVAASGVKAAFMVLVLDLAADTFGGQGLAEFWMYNEDVAEWVRVPDLDYDLSEMKIDDPGSEWTGTRKIAFPAVEIPVQHGRFLWRLVGVQCGSAVSAQQFILCEGA